MDKIEVTQDDKDAAASLMSDVGLFSNVLTAKAVQAFARHRLATRTDATPVAEAWEVFEAAMKDPEYAWGWHCNLAVPIIDATGITHEQANMAAAHLMQHLWKCDITTHPHYQYEKSGAQSYAEFRIEADKAEDAVLPDATHPPATDVAALVEAAKKIMPIRVNDGPDYAEVYFADGEKHSTHAMTMNPQDWLDLSAALAPFTKGQNDDAVR